MASQRLAPIGVFDSGLGGLTVASAISKALPNEHLIYLGDTARVPYGTRSAHTIIRYARACARKLCEHDIKLLVVACNTVSAVALDMLRVELDIPVIGVIAPGARAGVAACKNGKLGVIATAGTVGSGAYVREVAATSSRVEVFAHAAPLLVPLVEEGWLEGDVPRLAVRRYLEALQPHHIDSLVLGCTHYPLLRNIIVEEAERTMNRPVNVVDSAHATALELAQFMADRELSRDAHDAGTLRLLVTDWPGRFVELASRFLGLDATSVDAQQVDL